MNPIERILAAASFVFVGVVFLNPDSAIGAEADARWEVDYGGTECRLIRHFGSANKAYRLEVQKSWSFGGYDVRLYGGNVPMYSSPTTITVGFGSPPKEHRFKTNPYMFDDGNERAIGWNDSGSLFISALHHARRVSFTGAKELNLALDLPNADSAIKALEACEDDLVTGWGFDASQQRSLTTQVKPSNYPGRWITNDDYPRGDFASKNEGITTFLLNVGADGATTGCRIVGSSGFPSLDKRTCELLLRRAAFHPATDGAGKTVPSFYVNLIRWRVPR